MSLPGHRCSARRVKLSLVCCLAILLAAPLALLVTGSALASSGDDSSPRPSPLPQASGLTAAPGGASLDTTPPTTVATGADALWNNKPVTVTLTASDDPGGSGVASITYSLDGDAPTTVAGATTQVTIAAPANHANDGSHTLSFYATDNAGNAEVPQSLTVKIDTRRPYFHWLSVKPALITSLRAVRFRFAIRESSGAVAVSLRVYDQYGVRVLRRADLRYEPGIRHLNLKLRCADKRPFMPGLYRLQLSVTDQAGNRTTSRLKAFRDELPVKAAVWREVPGAGHRVALTFDDGYDKVAWASILATLHASGVHASFFVNGCHVASYPTLARRTIAWGEAIGSHTYSHILTTSESPAQIYSQVQRDLAVWWRVAHATPLPYFRPPDGSYDAATLEEVGAAGFARVILWSVDPSDYTDPGPAVIAARVLSQVHSGSIVALHLKPQTAAALPAILGGLRARHLRPVSLPQLFHAAGYR